MQVESHPFEPFFPANATVLICGTFPARPEKWSMEFYYPNFQNDMWRVFGVVFFNDKDYFVDAERKTYRLAALKAFLAGKGIAFSDTGSEIVRKRGNASDKDLEIKKPIDLAGVLKQLPAVSDIVATGKLAAEVLAEIIGCEPPAMGRSAECVFRDAAGNERQIRLWRMPSTSRAYPASLSSKADAYRTVLDRLKSVD